MSDTNSGVLLTDDIGIGSDSVISDEQVVQQIHQQHLQQGLTTKINSTTTTTTTGQQPIKKEEDDVPARERLQKALLDPDNVDNLDLSTVVKKGEKLTEADYGKVNEFTIFYGFKKMIRCGNVKQLNISGQDGSLLPDNIATNMPKLEVLNLCKCHLRAIPPCVTHLPSLSELNLRLNALKTWPHELNKLKIKKLDLSFNDIAQLRLVAKQGSSLFSGLARKEPANQLLLSLKCLDLGFNQLNGFPTQVYEFVHLEELCLSRNSIVDIPTTIIKMADHLFTLRMEEAGFCYFPEAICELTSLTHLNLSYNKIHTLPAAAMKLNMLINLKELYMNNCELKGWSQLYCQAKLRTLHLMNNQIQGIPYEVATLVLLEDLRLQKNMISHIPDHVQNFKMLRYFDVSNNNITEIDESIGALVHLEVLLLNNNQISEFPDTLGSLTSLTELNLSDNRLTSLPDVSKLAKLKSLEAANNMIKQLPKGIGGLVSLQKFDLSMNRIETLPDDFYTLKNLVFLRMKHNLIDTLDSTKLVYLTSLEEANFDNNALTQVPACLVNMGKLKIFLMNYNLAKAVPIPEDIKQWALQNNVRVEVDVDLPCQVLDNLYISSANAATSKNVLQNLGVTHILTSANGIPPRYPESVSYMVIHVEDARTASLRPHFYETQEFIDEGRKKGAVIVHCMAGVSRSATIVTSYLMLHKRLRLIPAFKHLKSVRSIVYPNPQFRAELNKFDKELYDTVPAPTLAEVNAKYNKVEILTPGQSNEVRERNKQGQIVRQVQGAKSPTSPPHNSAAMPNTPTTSTTTTIVSPTTTTTTTPFSVQSELVDSVISIPTNNGPISPTTNPYAVSNNTNKKRRKSHRFFESVSESADELSNFVDSTANTTLSGEDETPNLAPPMMMKNKDENKKV